MNPFNQTQPNISLGTPRSSVSPFTATTTPQPQMTPYIPTIQPTAQPTVKQPQQTGTFGGTEAMPVQYSYVDGVSTPTGQVYKPPANINPQNYKIPVSTTVDSNMLNKPSPGAIEDAYNAKQAALRTGTDTNLIPSDSYYANNIQQNLYNQVGNLAQYSPEEQAALRAKAENDAKIYNTQLAARRQVKQLQEDGLITKEQGVAFISEAQRRADAQAADQAALGAYLNSSLDVYGKIRGNQLTAAQSQFGMLQPTQVGIGSTLYNPVTGVQYQPGGQAQSDVAQALVDGTMSPNQIPQGVNPAVVFQQANEISMRTKGVPFNANESQANFQAQQAAIQQNATTYRTLANAQQTAVTHLQDALGYAQQLTATGRFPVLNSVTMAAARALGDKTIGQYDTALSIARAEVAKVLGGGQVTDAGIAEAQNILPSNLGPEQLKAKIDAINALMTAKIKEYGSLSNIPQFGQQTQTGSSKVVQTKVGAVDNSWFNE